MKKRDIDGKLKKQMNVTPVRHSNWVGTRPVIFEDKRRKELDEEHESLIHYYKLNSLKEGEDGERE